MADEMLSNYVIVNTSLSSYKYVRQLPTLADHNFYTNSEERISIRQPLLLLMLCESIDHKHMNNTFTVTCTLTHYLPIISTHAKFPLFTMTFGSSSKSTSSIDGT
jgi:hypothetical protein